MNTQTEAERLADELYSDRWITHGPQWGYDAAAELLRLEADNKDLRAKLAEKPAPAAQQEPVAWGIIASNTGRLCQVELDADEVEGHNPKHIVPLCHCSQAQPAREPLTDEQIDKAAMKLAECMDYPWAQMPEHGKRSMRSHAKAVIDASGITKGNT